MAIWRDPEAHCRAIHLPPSPYVPSPYVTSPYSWPHVASATICTQFLEAENIPVLPSPAYSPDMSPIEMFGMLWIDVYDSVFQFPTISSNYAQPLKRSGDNILQATINMGVIEQNNIVFMRVSPFYRVVQLVVGQTIQMLQTFFMRRPIFRMSPGLTNRGVALPLSTTDMEVWHRRVWHINKQTSLN